MKKLLSLMAIITIALFVLTQSVFATDLTPQLDTSNPYTLQPLQTQPSLTQAQTTQQPTQNSSSVSKIDESTTETEKPKSVESELPKAGDASPIFFALAVLAVIATYAYTMYRKRV